jgi:hypothetical protein
VIFYELNWAQGSIEGHVSSIIIATAIINAECSQSFGVIVRRRRHHHNHHHTQHHHPCRVAIIAIIIINNENQVQKRNKH